MFDYIDGGAEDERTLRNNRDAFARIEFRPRVLRDGGAVDPSTTLLGRPLPFPLVLAPTGFTRIADPQGELAVARAAERADLPYTLSTLAHPLDRGGRRGQRRAASGSRSTCGATAASSRRWSTACRGRGYEALVLTVDTAVLGRRERDVRRGFELPPKIGLGTLLDGAVHPGWTWAFVRSEPIVFANVAGRGDVRRRRPTRCRWPTYVNAQFDPDLSWDDVDWLRSIWDGPIVLKGIQTVDDAVLAAERGVEAIALSNHGGRQLDSAPAPIDLVGPVADAVGDRTEIICDGGVRRGSDIVKAVALGATACMAGRAYLYGLGAAGERGVDHVLACSTTDVRRTMALVGAATIADLTPASRVLTLLVPLSRCEGLRTERSGISGSQPVAAPRGWCDEPSRDRLRRADILGAGATSLAWPDRPPPEPGHGGRRRSPPAAGPGS